LTESPTVIVTSPVGKSVDPLRPFAISVHELADREQRKLRRAPLQQKGPPRQRRADPEISSRALEENNLMGEMMARCPKYSQLKSSRSPTGNRSFVLCGGVG
jgi:hypothetical protein